MVIDDSNFKSEGTAVVVLNRMKKSWLDAKILSERIGEGNVAL